ncbi:MAG: protease complex subunit PrcB family protein [Pseudomonadota bacterium]
MPAWTRLLGLFPAAMLLSACSANTPSTPSTPPQQSLQGFAVGEPSPAAAALDNLPFVAMARSAPCSEVRNHLYVIDQKQVFWDRAGNCADNAYAQVLFGANPNTVLCTSADTIAGPRTTCTDENARALFETARQNAGKADLGLGASHAVKALSFLPADGSSLPFKTLERNSQTAIHSVRNLTITDAAGWAGLWAEHTKTRAAAPAMPNIDFGKSMVIALFNGEPDNCYKTVNILRVGVAGGKVVVEYAEDQIQTLMACSPGNSGLQLAVTERAEGPVEFVNVSAQRLHGAVLEASDHSGIASAQTALVKDAQAWDTLWARHSADQKQPPAAPAVDFSSNMVVAVFAGNQPGGCYTLNIENVYRNGGALNVLYRITAPGREMICKEDASAPAQMLAIARSTDNVRFVDASAFN